MSLVLEKITSGLTFPKLRRMFYLATPEESQYDKADDVTDYYDEAIGWFMVFIAIELIVLKLKGRDGYRLNDTMTSLAAGMLSHIFKIGCKVSVILTYESLYSSWRLVDLPVDSIWTWVACFILQDFLYYLGHRATHEVGIFWGFHQMHHSSERYNLASALRQGAFQDMLLIWFDSAQAFIIPPPIFLVHRYLVYLYQFWLHTEAIDNLGPLEYILNTPAHHRVHHGRNAYCIDKNYGGTLIIWDILFGTFEWERKSDPPVYGLVDNVRSFNQLYCQLFDFKVFAYDKPSTMSGWSNKIKAVFYPPGWFPGTRLRWFIWPRMFDSEEGIPEVENPVNYYDPKVPKLHTVYAFCQFLILIAAYTYYIDEQEKMDNNERFVLFAGMLLTMQCLGAVLDGKNYALALEVGRLLAVSVYILMTDYAGLATNMYVYIHLIVMAAFMFILTKISVEKPLKQE